jgi:hypothetical protein
LPQGNDKTPYKFFYGRSHCCARSRFAFDVHSLPRGKERTKKTRQDVPSWNSRGFAAGHPTAGCAVGLFMPASVLQEFWPFRFRSKFAQT